LHGIQELTAASTNDEVRSSALRPVALLLLRWRDPSKRKCDQRCLAGDKAGASTRAQARESTCLLSARSNVLANLVAVIATGSKKRGIGAELRYQRKPNQTTVERRVLPGSPKSPRAVGVDLDRALVGSRSPYVPVREATSERAASTM
jgi:hypothetical protein